MKIKNPVALVADAFPPLRTSGAVQLYDLALEFLDQGIEPIVLVASPDLGENWRIEEKDGIKVLRLNAPKTKDVNYFKRTFGEIVMPVAMRKNFLQSPYADQIWSGVVWYSPTIFLGSFARMLKNKSQCRGYLIIRDIFPQWAIDVGVMKKSLPYYFFKAVENYQYSVADVIGVQARTNLSYFYDHERETGNRVEVLNNWISHRENIGCDIDIAKTRLAGRVIFVYAGNMGIAQGLDDILDMCSLFKKRKDVGFLFIGRGSEVKHLHDKMERIDLDNVLFFDEINPSEIPGLYAQCHIGIVTLDRQHKTDNIPGKFLSYMEGGLPVLCHVNPGNDLARLVRNHEVGRVYEGSSIEEFYNLALDVVDNVAKDKAISSRCQQVAKTYFSSKRASMQVIHGLSV